MLHTIKIGAYLSKGPFWWVYFREDNYWRVIIGRDFASESE